MNYSPIHTFHIPVMGLAYTIDSPVKVARFGISSVISIVEDHLIEMMRSHYFPAINQPYWPITTHEPDFRAKRITDYLNLLNTIVQAQVEKLRNAAFETGSEIEQYFLMLPEDSVLKQWYHRMKGAGDEAEKQKMEAYLRTQIKPGAIDVNIMTKIDRNAFNSKDEIIEDGSEAVAAMRGYINSNLTDSSVVFSAGLNPRLYNYLENSTAFDPDEKGGFKKKIIIKVSDYRSAIIQGKYLAKKGIWVSQFRIESGLNCGGHAFATDGFLMGPILEEFKIKRQELVKEIFEIYNAALFKKNGTQLPSPPLLIISAQGGIGTHEEDAFLRQYYQIDSTGWGTPFLLVPEATTVDQETLDLLSKSQKDDVVLSRNSPLGVRFHYLKGTSADREKLARIAHGKPGSPCTEKHLAFNTEFTTAPICTASRKYQQLKIEHLQSLNLPASLYEKELQDMLDKECLCIGLSNAAAINYDQVFIKNLNAVTICPGPNIANFSKVVSLQTMINHIYGRENVLTNPSRPHMFIAELNLYVDYLKESLEDDNRMGQLMKRKKYYTGFYQNLRDGIDYYKTLPLAMNEKRNSLTHALDTASIELDLLNEAFEIMEVKETALS